MSRNQQTVTFRLLVPQELASMLLDDRELHAIVSQTVRADDENAAKLNLDLTAAATIMTLVVGAAQLGDYALRIARAAAKYWAEARTRRAERMIVQGAERDRVIDLRNGDPEGMAATIEQTAARY